VKFKLILQIENLVSIDAVCRYHIPEMVPPGGQISFDAIAQKVGLEKHAVRRLLRHAMGMRILREPEPEMVAHTSISRFLTKADIDSWVEFESRDTWPATTRVRLQDFLCSLTLEKSYKIVLTHRRRSSTLFRNGLIPKKPTKQ
jgi:hypothetical protein